MFGQSSGNFGSIRVIFGRFRVVFGNLRKVSYDLRKSSEGFARSSTVFEIHGLASGSLPFNFGYLRFILHSCCTFLHCVTLFCTVLTQNALLFSQSEPSNFSSVLLLKEQIIPYVRHQITLFLQAALSVLKDLFFFSLNYYLVELHVSNPLPVL